MSIVQFCSFLKQILDVLHIGSFRFTGADSRSWAAYEYNVNMDPPCHPFLWDRNNLERAKLLLVNTLMPTSSVCDS